MGTGVGARLLLLSWALCCAGPGFSAQPTAIQDSSITLGSIAAKRTDIEQAQNLPEEQRKQLLAKLDEARAWVEEANKLRTDVRELHTSIQDAPKRLAQLRAAAQQARPPWSEDEIQQWDTERLETTWGDAQQRLDQAQAELLLKERERTAYVTEAKTGGADIATLEKRLGEIRATSQTSDAQAGDAALASANQIWRAAQMQMLEARIAWLTFRQDNLGQLTDLTQAEKEAYAKKVAALQDAATRLREAVQARRQHEAEVARRGAQEAQSEAPPELKSLQAKITELVTEQGRLVGGEAQVDRWNERNKRLLDALQSDLDRLHHIVEVARGGEQISAMLQKRRTFAPSKQVLNRELIDYQRRLSDAVLRQLELDELIRDTGDADSQIQQLLSRLPEDVDEAQRERLQTSAEQAWSTYRNAALDLLKAYTGYVGKLSTLEAITRQLRQTAKAYRAFLDDTLLWIPSTSLVPLTRPAFLLSGLQWFIDPDHMVQLGQDSLRMLAERAPLVLAWMAGLLVLVLLRRRSLSVLKEAANATFKVSTDRFNATLAALGHTLVLILPLPVLTLGAGILLGGSRTAHVYTWSIAAALQGIGFTLFFLGGIRQLCRDSGLARAHLRWHAALCNSLGRQAIWLTPLVVPLVFLFSASVIGIPSAFIWLAGAAQTDEPGLIALGRLAFVAMMVLLAVVIHRIWRRGGPVIQDLAQSPDGAKWVHYHFVWFAPALLLPIGLAAAALAGFYYTATFLTAKVGQTVWFMLGLVLTKDLLLRGLYVTQRRLRLQEALRRREELMAQRAAAAGEQSSPEADNLPLKEDKIDYGSLSDQVRQLLQVGYTVGMLVGLWWIWTDVIPALGFLDTVHLPITTSMLVDGVTQEVSLTLGDMVFGLLFGGLTLLAARNAPGLLELTLLQRLPMSRASRYALTTLTQYLVAMIGLVITFKALGFQWSNIQWLVAALSVGLGFGLQEIVANFVSGIILLFEQPIRVGDVVTVDGITGTVARIRIRATTIVNWDRQELVIPNKTFITGQLVNWTLSDTINRVVITVGVAYGSDTRKAMRLMREAAEEHPKVLEDPAPRVTFEGFGDNALTLLLRAYLDDMDARLATTTELHQAINDRFNVAGIVIAFPQRDVHIDTARPLELVLRRDAVARDEDHR
jgi:potassium efflux system protein